MAKFPAFQFYVKDWLSDDKLRLCSLAARGMWIDMLCLMYNSECRGKLITAGKPWTDEQIVYSVSCPDRIEDRHRALDELKQRLVAKVDTDGAVYNARMMKDEHIRLIRSDAGSKGGKICSSKTSSKTQAKPQAKLKQTTAVCRMQNAELFKGGMGGNDLWSLACECMTGDTLRTPRFEAAWQEWVAYRAERKPKLTPASIRKQIPGLELLGHDGAIERINRAIANGWQGIVFADDRKQAANPQAGGTTGHRAAARGREYGEPDRDIPSL